MAKYRVIERSWIDNKLVEPGAIVDVEFKNGGQPGWNLEAVKDGAAPVAGSAPSADADEAARVRRVAMLDKLVDAGKDPAAPDAHALV